jgi:integrase
MKLSQTRVAKIKEPGRYGDGRGLYLQITQAGSRSWLLRYELRGRERAMGLGPCADFTLEEARERARLARQLLKDGTDPLDVAHKERAKAAQAAAKTVTFRNVADHYFEFHSPKWKNKRHRAQFHQRMTEYVFPAMGALPVAAIDKTLILKAIQPIWATKNATAARTLRLIKAVLDYAKVNGWRDGDNPALWAGVMEHALPTLNSNKHHPALPFVEVHDFMQKLLASESVAARALEFTILTAARTSEVIGARWSEIDLQAKLWTVPAERTKTKKEHRVPLSARTLEILKATPREKDDGYVFIGVQKDKPLGASSMDQVLKRIHPSITVHGFRSTFRDWAAEKATYAANHVVEMALAHAIASAVEAAYRRGDLLAQRARLMVEWARYCMTKPVDTTSNVTPMRARV